MAGTNLDRLEFQKFRKSDSPARPDEALGTSEEKEKEAKSDSARSSCAFEFPIVKHPGAARSKRTAEEWLALPRSEA